MRQLKMHHAVMARAVGLMARFAARAPYKAKRLLHWALRAKTHSKDNHVVAAKDLTVPASVHHAKIPAANSHVTAMKVTTTVTTVLTTSPHGPTRTWERMWA